MCALNRIFKTFYYTVMNEACFVDGETKPCTVSCNPPSNLLTLITDINVRKTKNNKSQTVNYSNQFPVSVKPAENETIYTSLFHRGNGRY